MMGYIKVLFYKSEWYGAPDGIFFPFERRIKDSQVFGNTKPFFEKGFVIEPVLQAWEA